MIVAQSDSPVPGPGENKNLNFIGVAGAVAISLLLILMAIVVIIRRYHQSKRAKAPLGLDQHIYDTPDSYDLRPCLPPRQSKLQRTGQLCSVDTKHPKPIEGVQNCAKMEENRAEELKEISDLTGNDCCRKMLNNYSPEHTASLSIPVQVDRTKGHILDHNEGIKGLCGPTVASSFNLNVLSSGKNSGYEQIQCYDKIQQYEQIQGYEKIHHCNVNLAQLVDETQVETVPNPVSNLALSKQIALLSEDIRPQCDLADSCYEYKGDNPEISLRACQNRIIEESGVPIALDSASAQIESPIPVNIGANEGLQENDMGPCLEGYIISNLGGYERICRYERIEHCDVNLAHMLAPTIAEDVANTE